MSSLPGSAGMIAVDQPFRDKPKALLNQKVAIQSACDRALDQWRGFALLLVLISHGFFTTGRVPGIGRAGVNLFFFISGILVFRSLSAGPQQPLKGASRFWFRRIKRLIPAKYFYLFFISIILVVLPWPLITDQFQHSFFVGLPSAILYYRNYYIGEGLQAHENLAGHLWSLACEMQFYILAPFIFFAGGRSYARQMIVYGTVLLIMLAKGVSVITQATYEPYTFGVAAWPMMAGFFVEFLNGHFPERLSRFTRTLAWCGAFSILALILATLTGNKKLIIAAGAPLLVGCLGCYLGGLSPTNWLGNSFTFLGNRTYSIYLWQQPLTIGGLVPPVFHPIGSLLSVAIGSISFRFLELPFMSKFKKKPLPSQGQ